MTQTVASNNERPRAAFLTPDEFRVGEGLQASEAFSSISVELRHYIAAACAGRRFRQDLLTTLSTTFDWARGITPTDRAYMHWIAANGRWLIRVDRPIGGKKFARIWHGVRSGQYTANGLPDEVVAELVRIGVVWGVTKQGDYTTDLDYATHARLEQVA